MLDLRVVRIGGSCDLSEENTLCYCHKFTAIQNGEIACQNFDRVARCISTCTNPFCPFTYTSLKQQCVQRVIARVLRLCHRVLQASNNQHRKNHLNLCIQLRDILVRKFSHNGSASARTNPRGSPQGFVFVRFDQDGGVSPKLPRY